MHQHSKRPAASNHTSSSSSSERLPVQSSVPSSLLMGVDVHQLQRAIGNRATMQLMRSGKNSVIQRMKFDAEGEEVDLVWGGKIEDIVVDTSDVSAFKTWSEQQTTLVLKNVYAALKGRGNVDREEAIAKSHLKMLLVARNSGEPPENGLSDLPKKDWWKLFIDRGLHNTEESNETNALRFDMESSPGFYDAMMNGLEKYVAPATSKDPSGIGPIEYMEMHQDVTKGTLIESHTEQGKYIPIPNYKSGSTDGIGGTSFGMTKVEGSIPSLTAYIGMAQSGIVALEPQQILKHPKEKAGDDDSSRFRFLNEASKIAGPTDQDARTKLTMLEKSKLTTRYEQSQMETLLEETFKNYYEDIRIIHQDENLTDYEFRQAKLEAVVNVIRELHVSHFFTDANGRLNTVLLLNRFLIEQGFGPVIMDDTSMFGGGFSVGQLVGQVKRGMDNFNDAAGLDRQWKPQVRDYKKFSYEEEELESGNVLHLILFDPTSYLKKDLKEINPKDIEVKHLQDGVSDMIIRFCDHGELIKLDEYWRFEFTKSLHALHVENELTLYEDD